MKLSISPGEPFGLASWIDWSNWRGPRWTRTAYLRRPWDF